MKSIRQARSPRRRTPLRWPWWLPAVVALLGWPAVGLTTSAPPPTLANRDGNASADPADLLVQRTIQRLALGDAFDAKLRQRTWTRGREVVGIGRYEQSGGGSGRFSLEMTIHDGDARHEERQISDGKLAWIRTQIADTVSLKRIDVGRVREMNRSHQRGPAAHLTRRSSSLDAEVPVAPWLKIGGLAELIDRLADDFDLRLSRGKIEQTPVWILRGTITPDARQRILGDTSGSPLLPHEVRLAIRATGDESGFGAGLPARVEFWSRPTTTPASTSLVSNHPAQDDDPPASDQASSALAIDAPSGRLISTLEIYAVRKIRPSPEQRFRFEPQENDVIFSDDTQRYIDRLTARQADGNL